MIDNLIKHAKKFVAKKALESVYGFDAKHLALSNNHWSLITWNQDEVPHLADNKNILSKIDKLVAEMLNTDRKTTVNPNMVQLINYDCVLNPKKILIHKASGPLPNILTKFGMVEMAKRNTGTSQTANSYHAVGKGTTAESLNDTQLQTEVARLRIGESAVFGQTERYGTAMGYTDVGSVDTDITEAGILTASSDGILILRVTSEPQSINTGDLLTVQTNVSHKNGTEI